MRSRLLLVVGAMLATLAHTARAQGDDRLAAGLTAGDYVRISGGVTKPVNPQGSLKDWSRGTGVNVGWENWQNGGAGGVGRVGVAINVGYSLLPLDEAQFLSDFTPISGGKATSASASNAGVFELSTNLRLRIPTPIIMPTINFGIGFMNWAPAKIDYTNSAGSGSAKQRHRSGAELTIGGGLERHIVDRFAVFVDAAYVYGFTSIGGQASATPGGLCSTGTCDALSNTSVATLRGGLSVRVK
jgi:hypothetical protein